MISDLVAAVPRYLGQSFSEAAPGHRFQIYFNHWEAGNFAAYKDARLPNIQHLEKNERDRIREEFNKRKNRAVGDACPLPDPSKAQIKALRDRQQALHTYHGASGYRISTKSTAPFATGLGNEHPIENGFAFLTPYGLPYLAGSGVKGILRRAMQELRDDQKDGFSDEAINALFGPENVNKPEDAQRGALDFWDVFPNPAGGRLVVEIMTPHFGKYYQGSDTPHDSGQPIPVSFLAVPAKSDFDFHVVCHPSRLPAALQSQWRSLLDQAFAHAFEWVGFGAKTSVGYGAMNSETMLQQKPDEAKESEKQQEVQRQEQSAQAWTGAKVKFNRANKSLNVEKDGQTAVAIQPKGEELLGTLPAELRTKIMGNQFVKVTAYVAEGVLVRVSP